MNQIFFSFAKEKEDTRMWFSTKVVAKTEILKILKQLQIKFKDDKKFLPSVNLGNIDENKILEIANLLIGNGHELDIKANKIKEIETLITTNNIVQKELKFITKFDKIDPKYYKFSQYYELDKMIKNNPKDEDIINESYLQYILDKNLISITKFYYNPKEETDPWYNYPMFSYFIQVDSDDNSAFSTFLEIYEKQTGIKVSEMIEEGDMECYYNIRVYEKQMKKNFDEMVKQLNLKEKIDRDSKYKNDKEFLSCFGKKEIKEEEKKIKKIEKALGMTKKNKTVDLLEGLKIIKEKGLDLDF